MLKLRSDDEPFWNAAADLSRRHLPSPVPQTFWHRVGRAGVRIFGISLGRLNAEAFDALDERLGLGRVHLGDILRLAFAANPKAGSRIGQAHLTISV